MQIRLMGDKKEIEELSKLLRDRFAFTCYNNDKFYKNFDTINSGRIYINFSKCETKRIIETLKKG